MLFVGRVSPTPFFFPVPLPPQPQLALKQNLLTIKCSLVGGAEGAGQDAGETPGRKGGHPLAGAAETTLASPALVKLLF